MHRSGNFSAQTGCVVQLVRMKLKSVCKILPRRWRYFSFISSLVTPNHISLFHTVKIVVEQQQINKITNKSFISTYLCSYGISPFLLIFQVRHYTYVYKACFRKQGVLLLLAVSSLDSAAEHQNTDTKLNMAADFQTKQEFESIYNCEDIDVPSQLLLHGLCSPCKAL